MPRPLPGRSRAVALALSLAVPACTAHDAPRGEPAIDGAFGAPRMLVFNAAWQRTEVGDPYPEHHPGAVTCTRAAQHLEIDALELDSGACNYLLLEAPTLSDVWAGDRITVRAFHNALAAPEPSVAHIALSIDGDVLWDQSIPIPSPATPYTVVANAEFSAPAGTPVVLHLHNHGVNTYRLIDVRIESP